jgi:hypothetical protein
VAVVQVCSAVFGAVRYTRHRTAKMAIILAVREIGPEQADALHDPDDRTALRRITGAKSARADLVRAAGDGRDGLPAGLW